MTKPIKPKEFDESWKALHDSVFVASKDNSPPFRDPNWKPIVIRYGLNMGREIFNALSIAAQEMDDHFLIIKDAEIVSPREPAYKIRWDYGQLVQVTAETILGHVDTDLFGQSGSWGMRCTVHDFSWLGGNPTFIKSFCKELGGEDRLREDFLRFAEDEWQAAPDGKREILASIGWLE